MKPAKLFELEDYKEVIRSFLKEAGNPRGLQSELAREAGCQASFLSQVLTSHVHLTLDHASGISQFWRLNEDEEEYFFSLVELARSSTPRLKSFFQKKILHLQRKQNILSDRLKLESISDSDFHSLYYSAWYYAAIHVVVSIPQFNTTRAIVDRFAELPEVLIEKVLEDLKNAGLIEQNNARWRVTKKHIHLPSTSPFMGIHHSHWRQRSITNVYLPSHENVHYSVVQALSIHDLRKLRMLLMETIEKNKTIVGPSPEEELVCLNIDLFRV